MSTSEYKKEHYDTVILQRPKGKKAELLALANEKGKTVKQVIIDAIAKSYGLYLDKPKP